MTRHSVARDEQVLEHRLLAVSFGDRRLLLTRVQGRVFAMRDRCPHLGFSMAKGRCQGGVIECPWHGSRFDVRSGDNVDWVCAFAGRHMPAWSHRLIALGVKPAPLTLVDVHEGDDGFVYVKT